MTYNIVTGNLFQALIFRGMKFEVDPKKDQVTVIDTNDIITIHQDEQVYHLNNHVYQASELTEMIGVITR